MLNHENMRAQDNVKYAAAAILKAASATALAGTPEPPTWGEGCVFHSIQGKADPRDANPSDLNDDELESAISYCGYLISHNNPFGAYSDAKSAQCQLENVGRAFDEVAAARGPVMDALEHMAKAAAARARNADEILRSLEDARDALEEERNRRHPSIEDITAILREHGIEVNGKGAISVQNKSRKLQNKSRKLFNK